MTRILPDCDECLRDEDACAFSDVELAGPRWGCPYLIPIQLPEPPEPLNWKFWGRAALVAFALIATIVVIHRAVHILWPDMY